MHFSTFILAEKSLVQFRKKKKKKWIKKNFKDKKSSNHQLITMSQFNNYTFSSKKFFNSEVTTIVDGPNGIGYVNATQLCAASGNPKNNWFQLKGAKELILLLGQKDYISFKENGIAGIYLDRNLIENNLELYSRKSRYQEFLEKIKKN